MAAAIRKPPPGAGAGNFLLIIAMVSSQTNFVLDFKFCKKRRKITGIV
jgi:hypothetical protein